MIKNISINKILNKMNWLKIIDVVIVFLLIILQFKKGGFYKTDTIFLNLSCSIVAFIYLIIKTYLFKRDELKKTKESKIVNNVYKTNKKIDVIGILILSLAIIYILPIVFKTYISLADSIFEMIRVFNVYIIYKIVKLSQNKKIYVYLILIIATSQYLLGIDGLGNRYLEGFLKLINSGYLNTNLTRLSGTIQYANNVAIISCISFFLLLDMYIKRYRKIDNKNEINSKSKNVIKEENKNKIISNSIYTLLYIFLSTFILTNSRMVLFITIIAGIIYYIKTKENKKMLLITYAFLIISSIIYTTVLSKYFATNGLVVYATSIIGVIISWFVGNYIYNLKQNNLKQKNEVNIGMDTIVKTKENNNDNNNKRQVKTYTSIFVIIFIVYILIGLNLHGPLVLDSQTKQNKLIQNVYGINKDKDNSFLLDIKENEEDSRYKIVIYEIYEDYSSKVLKQYEYYDNVSGDINFSFKASNHTRYLTVDIYSYKGSISVDNILLNNKNNYLNYKILPSEQIIRLKDLFYGTTSLRDRVEYLKDSFKILTKNPTTFIVGTGGEGFKNSYSSVQTLEYISTEVHNSFLQIFVESGLLGFSVVTLIIIFSLIKSKNNILKLVYVIFLIHSFVDLNFSYMLTFAMFGILLGLLENNENELIEIKSIKIKQTKQIKQDKIRLICNVEKVVFVVINICVSYILITANIAYYMKIPKIDESDLNITKQLEVVSLNEKRTKLDYFEKEYRKDLNKEYIIYLKLLDDKINNILYENNYDLNEEKVKAKEELKLKAKEVVNNIDTNNLKLKQFEKQDKYVYSNIADIYFYNIDLLSKYRFDGNLEIGYKYYTNEILECFENIYKNNKINRYAKDIINNSYEDYNLIVQNKINETNNINNNKNLNKILQEFLIDFENIKNKI
jgi:hypothetical protein